MSDPVTSVRRRMLLAAGGPAVIGLLVWLGFRVFDVDLALEPAIPSGTRVTLPAPTATKKFDLAQSLDRLLERSVPAMLTGTPPSLADLAAVLQRASALHPDPRMRPLLFLADDSAVHAYDPGKRQLVRIDKGKDVARGESFGREIDPTGECGRPGVALIVCAPLDSAARAEDRFGPPGTDPRQILAAYEARLVGELVARSLGLVAVPRDVFDRRALARRLGLAPGQEPLALLLLSGIEASSDS